MAVDEKPVESFGVDVQAADKAAEEAKLSDAQLEADASARLMTEIKNREYIHEFPIARKTVILRRWSWITATQQLPHMMKLFAQIIEFATVAGRVLSDNEKKIGNIGDVGHALKDAVEDRQKFIDLMMEAAKSASLDASHLIEMQILTLVKEPKNKMTPDSARALLENLEPEEGLELTKLIYWQNVDNIAKNLKGLVSAKRKLSQPQ